MICPRCNKISNSLTELGHSRIESCPQCKGIWFGKQELTATINSLRDDDDSDNLYMGWLDEIVTGDNAQQENLGKSGMLCPSCNIELNHYNYAGANNIVIDGCDSCGGLWLEPGELNKLLDFFIECDKILDTETENALLGELQNIKAAASSRNEALIDILISLDKQGALSYFPGLALQFFNRIFKNQERS